MNKVYIVSVFSRKKVGIYFDTHLLASYMYLYKQNANEAIAEWVQDGYHCMLSEMTETEWLAEID
jgi:hypothetical protein